ncbi:hypothetical protein F5B19DRAFT_496224 [Rostrohypoxylon terebratum]|nr:hypothetical protein F5B19DRAFT_496224 [Rostrohypoxylon terebratum]
MVVYRRYPSTRAGIIGSCPGKEASPSVVRDWFRAYLYYRGLDREASRMFLWRGEELYRAQIPELRDAFKQYCDLQEWEADIIATDVYEILRRALPVSERTFFETYVYYVLGCDSYRKLMFDTREPTIMDYVGGVSTWVKFLAGHLLAMVMVYGFFWAMTNHELPARLSRDEI